MRVDLGDADAAVGIGLGVVTDFLRELQRIGKLPTGMSSTAISVAVRSCG